MARIAVGGWQHETNTFATIRAGYESFVCADEWPAMTSGPPMLDAVREVHLPVAGAIRAFEEAQHQVVPLLWCSATPCSYVTEDAFERICGKMLGLLEQALPVDGIYLDLHGAMVCEHLQDGEGEFLSRLVDLVGRDVPVFISLDLHANVTARMVENATVIDIFRTYPHVDMGRTGYRVAKYLCDYLHNPCPIFKSFRQIDFLIPLNTGCTLIEPCRSIYREFPRWINPLVPSLSFACGFHLSDIHDAGPAVVGYGHHQAEVDQAVDRLVARIREERPNFSEKIWDVDEGIKEAMAFIASDGGTVVIADTQDNPGGGGAGDTIGILRSMMAHQVQNALIGVINNAGIAAAAHQSGIGSRIEIGIDSNAGTVGRASLHTHARVENLSDGRFTATGPMYRGANMEMGLTALLDISGIRVVVCSKPIQTADQAHFRHLGIEPETFDLVVVKSSVHFRNDFETLSSRIMIVAAPGEVYADPASLDYQNIRPSIEITPMG
ncbi:MAG: M81 family metallopeptidase [Gammaproteobacteria bacterium]|nr:M81 family metallopeptidase [Gammaproteobacteria bacterium]